MERRTIIAVAGGATLTLLGVIAAVGINVGLLRQHTPTTGPGTFNPVAAMPVVEAPMSVAPTFGPVPSPESTNTSDPSTTVGNPPESSDGGDSRFGHEDHESHDDHDDQDRSGHDDQDRSGHDDDD